MKHGGIATQDSYGGYLGAVSFISSMFKSKINKLDLSLLPSSCFPASYSLPSFKSKINKLDLISLLLAFRFLLSSFVGVCIGHHGPSPTCSQEIREIIPVSHRRVRTTRSSTHSHPFQVSLPTSRALSHKSSFIPRTCNLWSLLPSSCFPASYSLPSFKSKINKLDLISLLLAFRFLLSCFVGVCIGHHGFTST